jgi:hypothetical protein
MVPWDVRLTPLCINSALLAPKEYDPEGPEVPLNEYYAAEIVDIRGQMKKKGHDVCPPASAVADHG